MKNLVMVLITVFALTGCLSGGGTETGAPVTEPVAEQPTLPVDEITNPIETPIDEEEPVEDPADPEDEEDPTTPYAFSGGSGTVSDPYTLETATDVAHIADFPAAHFELIHDIHMGGAAVTPVPVFSGALYGNGFAIHHFTLTASSGNAALFTVMSGTVVQLDVENATINGGAYAASIAGHLTGLISSCNLYAVTINSTLGGNGVNTGIGRPFFVTKSASGSVIGSTYNVTFNGSHIFQF